MPVSAGRGGSLAQLTSQIPVVKYKNHSQVGWK